MHHRTKRVPSNNELKAIVRGILSSSSLVTKSSDSKVFLRKETKQLELARACLNTLLKSAIYSETQNKSRILLDN